MTSESGAFDFIESYRALQPAATREMVAARQSSHAEILKQIKVSAHVLDLCRLAFGIPIPAQSELSTMLLAEIHKGDVQFSLAHDRAEAGRIAALLLTERLAQGRTQDAVAVLATSFSGLRASADNDGVTSRAVGCLARATRARGNAGRSYSTILYPKSPDRSALVAALDQGITSQTLKPAFEALITDDCAAGVGIARAVTEAVQNLFSENQRLAEEVDLLWWHIGDWSECLSRPLCQVPERGRGLIAGADLAAMIRILPGPYGTAGILRRSFGDDADQPMTLGEAVEVLEPEDLRTAYPTCVDTDILPIHMAVQLYLDRGRGAWRQAFEKVCGVTPDASLSRYKIALQAFWERSLINCGWAK